MKVTFLLSIVLISSCFQSPKQNLKPKTLIIHNVHSDDIFNRLVNPLTDKYELPKLRNVRVSGNDLEVRVWVTGSDIDGFILKRSENTWSAIALKEMNCNEVSYYPKNKIYQLGKINLTEPESGWENAWKRLTEAGILDLPNSNEIGTIDGISYIVETNLNETYRIYEYSDPQNHKTEEDKRMMRIGEIIAEEFGLHNFKVGSLCIENNAKS